MIEIIMIGSLPEENVIDFNWGFGYFCAQFSSPKDPEDPAEAEAEDVILFAKAIPLISSDTHRIQGICCRICRICSKIFQI